MAGKYFIVVFVALLAGCAQVGRISGGSKDTIAPKPLMDEMIPSNATTNYTGNSFVIPFDEYFTLVNPLQTVRMVPPHATVDATVQKKTLTLTWEGNLEPNTTYAIYLNGTVKDVTENNDTTLQFVFSTGDQIDSISYSVAIMDAFTHEPLSDVTLVLSDAETGKLVSFAKSKAGKAQLNYLHKGTYKLLAFEDENADLEWQTNERLGFPETATISIDSNQFDSVPMRVFSPAQPLIYERVTFLAPGAFSVESNHLFDTLPNFSPFINGTSVDAYVLEEKKLTVFSPAALEGASAKITLETGTENEMRSDTLSYRFKKDEQTTPITIFSNQKAKLSPNESAVFSINALITSVDTSKIHITNQADTSEIPTDSAIFHLNKFDVHFDRHLVQNIKIRFDEGAVSSAYGDSKAFVATLSLGSEEDFGTLLLDASAYSGPLVVQLLLRNEVMETITTDGTNARLEFADVPPGTYTFRVIQDENGNGYWDGGSFPDLQQPERIDTYSKPVKVRANWSVEVPLKPTVSNE